MFVWVCLALLLSTACCQQQSEEAAADQLEPLMRQARAIAPSYSSWCILHPQRCMSYRMLHGHDSDGPMKRFRFF